MAGINYTIYSAYDFEKLLSLIVLTFTWHPFHAGVVKIWMVLNTELCIIFNNYQYSTNYERDMKKVAFPHLCDHFLMAEMIEM